MSTSENTTTLDQVVKVKKPRKKNGKKFKEWDPAKERATYDTEFYEKHQKYYERALPGIADFVVTNLPNVKSIVDVGCGNGDMLSGLVSTHDILGIDFSDGAAQSLNIPRSNYLDHDLTKPLPDSLKNSRDLVLSLEVWEHIPEEFENQYVSNLTIFNADYMVVSCAAPGQWGRHHYNCAGVDEVREKMSKLGYVEDEALTAVWRKIKYLASFYRKNTLVLRKDTAVNNHV